MKEDKSKPITALLSIILDSPGSIIAYLDEASKEGDEELLMAAKDILESSRRNNEKSS